MTIGCSGIVFSLVSEVSPDCIQHLGQALNCAIPNISLILLLSYAIL